MLDEFGQTEISWACSRGDVNAVKTLLSKDASLVSAKSLDGLTPLAEAAAHGELEVVRLLLDHEANPNIPDEFGWTPLHLAAQGGHAHVVRELLGPDHMVNESAVDMDGSTALHRAARFGQHGVIDALLSGAIDMEATDKSGRTALDVACHVGHAEVVRTLLLNGADTDANAGSGRTALTTAARHGRLDAVKVLLDHGVDVNQLDKYEKSALDHACFAHHLNVVKLLLDRGAQLSNLNHISATCLVQAVVGGNVEIVKLLLERGADPDAGSINPFRVAQTHMMLDIAKLLRSSKTDTTVPVMSRMKVRALMRSIQASVRFFKRTVLDEAKSENVGTLYMSTNILEHSMRTFEALEALLVRCLRTGGKNGKGTPLKWSDLPVFPSNEMPPWVLKSYPLGME